MDTTAKRYDEGFSPAISAALFFAGERFEVGSLAHNSISLMDARPLPAGSGTVQIKVDDRLSVYHIDLPEGIDPSRERQPCQVVAATADAAA